MNDAQAQAKTQAKASPSLLMDLTEISVEEAVRLGAIDGALYSSFFFPRTARQVPSLFDKAVWNALDDPQNRYQALKIFRGGAKTTRLRLFGSRRIAYGISHSVVFVSNSEAHAARSVRWLRRQVLVNHRWAETFNLRLGGKKTDTELEIIHGVEEFPILVYAVGITGQVRGFLSEDDFRPDLIVVDDPDNEETTGTEEQRKKAHAIFFGALAKSLAPPTESPRAKMALLQTPLALGDLISTCAADEQWHSAEFGCLTLEGASSWPARFPLDFLQKEKSAHIRRNQLSLWMREMECKLVAEEASSFRLGWLKVFDEKDLPKGMWYGVAIDPASSEEKTADQTAIVMLGFHGPKVYLMDYFMGRGTMPDQVVNEMFRMIFKWRPRYIAVETIHYQKILAWYVRREMDQQRIYIPVREFRDKRKKSDRITQAIGDVAAHGNLFYRGESQKEFLEAFVSYYPNFPGHDDLLDAIAIGESAKTFFTGNEDLEGEYLEIREEERSMPEISFRSAP